MGTGGDELGDLAKLARDQRWFLAIFVVKVVLGLVAFAIKPWLGLLFFAAYAVYFWREIRAGGEHGDGEQLAPLLLQRRRPIPATWAVVVQTLATLAVIFAASQLPEIMNAVIWVRQGKTRLALANISGAMMIQATVPSGLGLLFTPWRFNTALLISGLATMAAIGYLLYLLAIRRLNATTLSWAAGFYLAFAAALIAVLT